jgi:hypothetical protein
LRLTWQRAACVAGRLGWPHHSSAAGLRPRHAAPTPCATHWLCTLAAWGLMLRWDTFGHND